MSLTVTEACAVHQVLRALVPASFGPTLDTVRPIDERDTREALALLADKANRTLMCGPTADAVRSSWGQR